MRSVEPCQPHVSYERYSVIIQTHKSHYRCITQHDHGIISGELALAWRDPHTGEAASSDVVLATYLHDVLWVPIDAQLRIHNGRPLDFLAYPEEDKLSFYAAGVAQMGQLNAYTGFLHARHFGEFVSREKHRHFRAHMDQLRDHFSAQCTAEQRARADSDLALLRLFDVFSLLLCMTGEGIVREPPPWLRPSPLMEQRGLQAYWDKGDVVFEPFCFDAPFHVAIPYRDIEAHDNEDRLRASFLRAGVQHQWVYVRGKNHAGALASPSEQKE